MPEYRCPIFLPHLGDRIAVVHAKNEEEAQNKIEDFVMFQIRQHEVTLLPVY